MLSLSYTQEGDSYGFVEFKVLDSFMSKDVRPG